MYAVNVQTIDSIISICYAAAGVCFTIGVCMLMLTRKENSPMTRHHPFALKYPAPVAQLDRRTNEALVRSVNRMTRTAEVARAVMEEMSVNHVTAVQQASQATATAYCLASRGPQTELAQAYLQALTERYLRRMVTLTDYADEVMIRQSFDDDESC